ncbi:Reticulocyte-binding protein 2 a [Madurella mycetomatis]|uniref:Reticulocyte-binding protein 2 a n=1 Tax=Madurella mycetomatis TaxID=100816 RepID=A0A175VS73_9PEZI|nr:Reticulocyte-binding protein 2 a [Madurella mycetomatis]
MTVSWDPERLLDIRGRARIRDGIQCHGENGGLGPRCGWTKGIRDDERPDVRDAEDILQSMARKPPSNVTQQELQRLAYLCLCRDHHMTPTQMYNLADKWARLVRNAMATQTPPQTAHLSPAPETAPVTAPTTTLQFTGTERQNTNWQMTLSAQVGSTVNSRGSQSTNGTQHQHADAPAGFASSRRSPSRERTEKELAITLARLSALQIQNEDLREEEQRLKALGMEHSTFRENIERELAATRTQLSSVQLENENLRNQEHRLEALDAEYSTFREHTRAELATTQEQLSALELENETLREKTDHLQALESEHSTSKKRVEDKLSQSLAENKKLKEKKDNELEALGRQHSALVQKEREALRKKDEELRALREQYNELEQKERQLACALSKKDDELQKLHNQYDELEKKARELDLSTKKRC